MKKSLFIFLVFVGLSCSAFAQQQLAMVLAHDEAAPAIQFAMANLSFVRDGLPVPRWQIRINADGRGSYSEMVAGTDQRQNDKTVRPIEVADATRQRLFAGRHRVKEGNCETKAKHLANTGRKELSYSEGALNNTCVFNYSDDNTLMDTLAAFQAIAETMQAGARLAQKHRFDRLGLDAEITSLAAAVKEGHAIELQNIAPILRSIVDDGEVLERVRTRASQWLAQMPAAAKPI